MKKLLLNGLLIGAMLGSAALTGCSNDDPMPDNPGNADRWVTVSGALMGSTPGDGNGGTMVYAVSKDDARNPEVSIDVFENGYGVRSNRTARLQASEDGSTLFNIAYTGDNGGEFTKYAVNGGRNFNPIDGGVNISQYAGTSPRWVKLFDGDRTGIAVNVTLPVPNNAPPAGGTFAYYRGVATVLALDFQETLISGYRQYEIPLTAEEELQGHTIFRLDAPVLNKLGNKLIIGTWMRKYDVASNTVANNFERLGTKSVVVDYPSLENPTIITSSVGHGDCSGYRSFNSFVASDGNIYQATQRDPKGSHILRINQNNEYDNSYIFSLDAALGVKGVYVDAWRYVNDNIAYVLYTHGGTDQGYVAQVDLSARTATKVEGIPYDADLDFSQYQGFMVDGDEVYIAVTPTGKNGNIYILNSKTNEVIKGATLINKPGNHYIGVF
ncbi:hypothetical protein [Anditalea andensis]|uniref:DUF4374 domain-containing protein n=1 Tax=Anditalea andensis TaxID=1048983 RepID=A0A074KUH2_9BACT|nr:hypothetical protein [Anditalea andensis]KEO71930.1 hypothetical protein EL17_20655 [Anditalea andensis]